MYVHNTILLSTIQTIASIRLCTLYLKQDREFDITLIQLSMLFITFDYPFHTSSTKPNPNMNFSLNRNVHSRL